jgi:Zn-dependent protease with chaperone function
MPRRLTTRARSTSSKALPASTAPTSTACRATPAPSPCAASLLGVNRYLTANGLNLGALLGFALVMGFGGAIISLLISKPMAKWSIGRAA